MREVNFSIPNVNKASVGITTALYDRRALDCTSTLPLINSLNHLAYLTTTSARIRDILTIDGGVERLVCILKQGRSQEMMEMWKWNLAFQCVVNIGVRGSESVRTRVVEADMVPVIATILDNYIKVIDKCREKAEAEAASRRQTLQTLQQRQNQQSPRAPPAPPVGSFDRQTFQDRGNAGSENRSFRRQDPPPSIQIPQNWPQTSFEQTVPQQLSDVMQMELTPTLPQFMTTSPPDRTSFTRHHHRHHHHHHHYHHRSQDGRHHGSGGGGSGSRHSAMHSIGAAVTPVETVEGFGLRPVRDADRLPSMLPAVPALQTGITSQPESPTTPSAPSIRPTIRTTRDRRRPSIRQQQSTSGDSDDANGDEAASETSVTNENLDEPMIDIQPTVDIQEAGEQDPMLDAVATTLGLTAPNVSEGQETETFNITHQSANDGSIINANVTPTTANIGFNQAPQPMSVVNAATQAIPQNTHARYLLDRSAPPGVLAATPRDEDVLMSLQLLAYVSKYCNLRTYFQQSHLVPKLKIGKNLNTLDDNTTTECFHNDEADEEEYLLPDDFNIFPLVEKFTVRHHSQDMQHWAGVVMRNLCRKDDARGGIRQCAYYECGRWEQWTRQFAKCRRCRRTKYCSKECQKNAWVFHRHWCQVAAQ
ncbi:hypothetical protein ABVK25_006683 [Lepraria finkii]|uniref:MYND-type zinc finger protein samB n=1 Tax=Lepraria finkii TaxID=1340010 RepID=A0ABR4B7M9_9LECA